MNVSKVVILLFTTLFGGRLCLAYSQESFDPSLETRRIVIKQQKMSMADALALVSTQAGLNIVAGDVPRRAYADIDVSGTVREVLDAIGKRFDYRWTQSRLGGILFSKQFNNPEEHPQINQAEAIETAKTILHILGFLGQHPNISLIVPDLHALYNSLTPTQRQNLLEGHSLLTRNLYTRQQQIVYKAILDQGFGEWFDIWEALLSKLCGLERSSLELVSMSATTTGGLVQPIASQAQLMYVWRDQNGEHRLPVPHIKGVLFPLSLSTPKPRLSSTRRQDVQNGSTRQMLRTSIKLPLGRTTLAEVTASLSTQTGLKIEAEKFLARSSNYTPN